MARFAKGFEEVTPIEYVEKLGEIVDFHDR